MPRTDTNLPPIARRLRALIARKGLSQADVAFAAGLSPQNLSELLRGLRPNPKIETIEKIVEAVGATMAELYETEI